QPASTLFPYTTLFRSSLKEALQLSKCVHLLEAGVSDSASFDNALDLLLRRGYSGASGMLAMVPPAWETNPQIPADLRRFLEAHRSEEHTSELQSRGHL